MKSVMRGNFIPMYKYKDRRTICLFSLGNKMPRATRKSLRGDSRFTIFTRTCLVAFYLPVKTMAQNVCQKYHIFAWAKLFLPRQNSNFA